MSWHLGRLAAFDIETTGVSYESDRVVTAAVNLVGDDRPVESHEWLVNPGVVIPAGATAVHGITTEQAQTDGQAPVEAIEAVTAMLADQVNLGVPIVAFNARFDLTLLDRDARRHGVKPLSERVGGPAGILVVDPYVIDKHFDRFRRGKRTLDVVCGHYKVQLDGGHTASVDAIAAARVAWKLAETFAELGEADPRTIHDQQVVWAAEQAESLEKYFQDQGRDEKVERAWPIVPLSAGSTPSRI